MIGPHATGSIRSLFFAQNFEKLKLANYDYDVIDDLSTVTPDWGGFKFMFFCAVFGSFGIRFGHAHDAVGAKMVVHVTDRLRLVMPV